MKKRMKIFVGALALIVGLAPLAAAESSTPSSDEIAKELANPNTVLTSLNLQIQYFSFDGNLPLADDQDMVRLYFQPTLPFPLENGKTLWVRPGVPYVFDQPIYDPSSRRLGSKSGLWGISRWTCSTVQPSKMAFSGASDSRRSFPRLLTNWGARCGLWGPAFSSAALARNLFSVYSPTTSGTLRATASRVQTSRISAGAMFRST